MGSESASGESTTDRDVLRKMLWILGIGVSIAMLHDQYLWSRFVLHSLATISFGGWIWTTLAIAAPWLGCFVCLSDLRDAVRSGRIDRDLCLRIAAWVEVVVLFAYWIFAPEIHRLTMLGALS
jgi:hypothetical protein